MTRVTDHIAFSLTASELKRIGRLGGWAPGSYMGKCLDCGGEIIGDKRASQCFVCAVEGLRRQVGAATMAERKRCIEIVDKARWSASSEAIIARIKSD
jgi:hypothetical protein